MHIPPVNVGQLFFFYKLQSGQSTNRFAVHDVVLAPKPSPLNCSKDQGQLVKVFENEFCAKVLPNGHLRLSHASGSRTVSTYRRELKAVYNEHLERIRDIENLESDIRALIDDMDDPDNVDMCLDEMRASMYAMSNHRRELHKMKTFELTWKEFRNRSVVTLESGVLCRLNHGNLTVLWINKGQKRANEDIVEKEIVFKRRVMDISSYHNRMNVDKMFRNVAKVAKQMEPKKKHPKKLKNTYFLLTNVWLTLMILALLSKFW